MPQPVLVGKTVGLVESPHLPAAGALDHEADGAGRGRGLRCVHGHPGLRGGPLAVLHAPRQGTPRGAGGFVAV